jgi:hypothetical protein
MKVSKQIIYNKCWRTIFFTLYSLPKTWSYLATGIRWTFIFTGQGKIPEIIKSNPRIIGGHQNLKLYNKDFIKDKLYPSCLLIKKLTWKLIFLHFLWSLSYSKKKSFTIMKIQSMSIKTSQYINIIPWHFNFLEKILCHVKNTEEIILTKFIYKNAQKSNK